MVACLAAADLAPDYAVVRSAESLLPLIGPGSGPGRALIACPVGAGARTVRLLDNAPWPAPAE
jgi:hypothetical protein